jgi:hypothetical protein
MGNRFVMMHVLKSLTMLVVFLLVSVSHGTTGDNRKLQLEIGLSKETYLLNEPIWLDVTLTNVSADTLRIVPLDPPCQGGVGIELRDSLKGFILNPGELCYDCFDLLQLYCSSKIKGLIDAYFLRFLPTGKYKVRALYRSAYSQVIEFEIIEPIGDEKEAYQLLHKAFPFLLDKKTDLMNQTLQELINRFPNSVYVEKAHRELFQRSELVEKFPNSGYNRVNLKVLTHKLAPREKREFLEKVIRYHPESRSANFAQQMLKWLEE